MSAGITKFQRQLTRRAHLVFISFVFLCTSAHGTMVKDDDVQKVNALWKTAVNLSDDIQKSGGLIVEEALTTGDTSLRFEATCLLSLQGRSERLAFLLQLSVVSLAVSGSMKDRDDEATTLKAVRSALAQIRFYLSSARNTVNSLAVACRSSPLANVKAQAILNLIGEIDLNVAPIARRLGAQVR